VKRILGLLLLTLLALSADASAQQAPKLRVGYAILCDTQKEVERYVELAHRGVKDTVAIPQVNKEFPTPSGGPACSALYFVYHRSETVITFEKNEGTYSVLRVDVFGFPDYTGYWTPIDAIERFTVWFDPAEPV
jgi:hypothetical protein